MTPAVLAQRAVLGGSQEPDRFGMKGCSLRGLLHTLAANRFHHSTRGPAVLLQSESHHWSDPWHLDRTGRSAHQVSTP